MFLGEYVHNLDYKGRVSVPKKFRDILSSDAVLTKGLDKCLFLYPKISWDKLSYQVSQLPVTGADARGFARYLFGGAVQARFDNLGRIAIPDYLIKYANLKKRVVIIGVFERVEIWGLESWKRESRRLDDKGAEIAEKLSRGGS